MTRREGASAPMHTPGPWKILRKSWPMTITGKVHQVTSEGRLPTAFVPAWEAQDDGDIDAREEAAANAEFIVRACNSYYDLLAALEDSALAIAYLMRQLKIVDSGWTTVDGRMLSLSSIETANATAIAKAKGGAA